MILKLDMLNLWPFLNCLHKLGRAAKRLKESDFVHDSSQKSFTASQRIFRWPFLNCLHKLGRAAKRLKESNFVRDSSQESFTASQRIFRVSEQHRKVFVFGSFLSARKNLDRGDSGAVFPRDVVAFSELLAQIGQSRETS
ncbi:unnamed protein product [Prunus armeniaca]|uniref:Uncharacterized protein n=1 Tax=Prunus armeniaca TaxID=36596 RepID=A0A6J5TX28_PRUAR|nr:unnamed protein product [Prunus armeniaca]CAB4299009.1 unnamed protein product [Prunus armeniaca]